MTLTEYLDLHAIPQHRFAAAIGASQPAVSKWVSGISIPRRRTMLRIEEATDGAVPPESWMRDLRSRVRPESAETEAA